MSAETQTRPITIVRSSPRYAQQMEDMMRRVYNAPPDELDGNFSTDMFRRHMDIFPEGQFIALEAGRVVGLTASMRLPFDPAKPFIEGWYTTISDGWLYRHDPAAEWMYGVESCVHPDYQGSGIGGKLMQARFDVAQALNLRGMVAGSAVISYYKVADTVSPEDYLAGVFAGTYWDNNLSKQMRKGFKPLALIPNYLTDADTRGWGVVIVWDNPTFDPAKPIGAATVAPRRYRIIPRQR